MSDLALLAVSLALDEITNNHTRDPPLVSSDREGETAVDEAFFQLWVFVFFLDECPTGRTYA